MEIPATTTIVAYHGNLKPEYARTVSDLQSTGAGVRIKKIFRSIIAGLIIGAIAGAICVGIAGKHARWPVYVFAGVALVVMVMEGSSIFKSQHAACPYCNADIGKASAVDITRTDKNVKVECPKCFEWLCSSEGQLRAFKPEDITDQKEFSSPVFTSGHWPAECIVCGKAVVKYGEAKHTSMNVGKLLVGKISVAWGSVKNVPYCAEHEDQVKLKVDDKEMFVLFNDYAARRRYLAVNPERKPSKG
jgi:hypothetical protein